MADFLGYFTAADRAPVSIAWNEEDEALCEKCLKYTSVIGIIEDLNVSYALCDSCYDEATEEVALAVDEVNEYSDEDDESENE